MPSESRSASFFLRVAADAVETALGVQLLRRGKARAAQIGVRAHAHDRAALLVRSDEHGCGRRRLVGRNVAFHLVRRFAVEIAAEQDVSAGTVFGGLSGGVRVRTACKEQLRSLLLKG